MLTVTINLALVNNKRAMIMKAMELKAIFEFMLASTNSRSDAPPKERGVYVELEKGGFTFTAATDGVVTRVKTRPKSLLGDRFLMFMPIDDIKNVLPSLKYECKNDNGALTVYVTKSTQPITGAPALRFEVGGWFEAFQGVKSKWVVPTEPSLRTNDGGALNRQEFLKSFDPLCTVKSAIEDEMNLNCHRSRVFSIVTPKFNLLHVSKTVYY